MKILKFYKKFNTKIKKDKIQKHHKVQMIQTIIIILKVILKSSKDHNLNCKNKKMNKEIIQ